MNDARPVKRYILYIVATTIIIMLFQGCSTIDYYLQSADGHLELMSKRQPIEKLLKQPELDAGLKERLQLALRARQFASKSLFLPDNDSYRTYADLQRPYVLWNVVAVPEFSIQAKQWCFLFVGCISYRGYFNKQEAEQAAAQLAQQGYDVQIAGVRAYSTLGWFNDPLLNTMLYRSDAALVGIIFHELAHQKLYISDDTAFNEAFATAVENEGVRRWFTQLHDETATQEYLQEKRRRREFYQLLLSVRERAGQLYKQDLDVAVMRQRKKALFATLQEEYKQWKRQRNDYNGYDAWMSRDLNNAHLALVATYQELTPAFASLLQNVDGDLKRFYQQVEQLGELPKPQRHGQLREYKQ